MSETERAKQPTTPEIELETIRTKYGVKKSDGKRKVVFRNAAAIEACVNGLIRDLDALVGNTHAEKTTLRFHAAKPAKRRPTGRTPARKHRGT